jgi:hypothetical protein
VRDVAQSGATGFIGGRAARWIYLPGNGHKLDRLTLFAFEADLDVEGVCRLLISMILQVTGNRTRTLEQPELSPE